MVRLALAALLLTGGLAEAKPGRHHPSVQGLRRVRSAARQDAALQRMATVRAEQSLSRAMELSRQASEAASRLRATDRSAVDAQAQLDALAARERALQAQLAHDRMVLARALPTMQRLSLYPAETLLAAPRAPADALVGLMVLHGLGRQIAADAERIRAGRLALARLADGLRLQNRDLARLREEQQRQDREVRARAARAADEQRASADAADEAARAAAASAARAADLQEAVARLQAAEQAAQARFAREAAASMSGAPGSRRPAERHRPAAAGSIKLSATAMTGAVPVEGRLVERWGALTDAGRATGIRYAPPALAVVTAPCQGRVDFAGMFRSFGRMVILDCGGGFRFVLAGLDRLDVVAGQRLAGGAPLGRMPDWRPMLQTGGRPTLYVQLRHGSDAVDPARFLPSPS